MHKVNLKAYCAAFEAMGKIPGEDSTYVEEICEGFFDDVPNVVDGDCGGTEDECPAICEFDYRPPDDKTMIYISKSAPGTIEVPQHFMKDNKRQISHWAFLRFNEAVSTSTNPNFFREGVSYFIAGAFGVAEVPSASSNLEVACRSDFKDEEFSKLEVRDYLPRNYFREDLNPTIVSGLQKLYPLCLKQGAEACRKSPLAAHVAQQWRATLACRDVGDDVANLRCEVNELKGRYAALEERVESKASLAVMTAPLIGALPARPEKSDDYFKVKQIYRTMIRIANALADEDAKRAEERDAWNRKFQAEHNPK